NRATRTDPPQKPGARPGFCCATLAPPHPPPVTSCRAGADTIAETKKPGREAGLVSISASELLRRRSLDHVRLERLVGLLGEIGIELADLGRLGHEAFVSGLGVVSLDFERLVE